MTSVPLGPFLTSLATDGIFLTSRDYERIGQVLQSDGPWTISRLKMVLLALLARDEEQQDLIAQRFDMFFTLPPEHAAAFADIDVQRALADLQHLTQQPRIVLPSVLTLPDLPTPSDIAERVTQTEHRMRPWLPILAIGVVVLLLIPALIWFLSPAPQTPELPFEVHEKTLTLVSPSNMRATQESITITSSASDTLNLSFSITGTHQSEFNLAETITHQQLAPGTSVDIFVTFQPKMTAASLVSRRAELQIDVDTLGIIHLVPLYGIVRPPADIVNQSPGSEQPAPAPVSDTQEGVGQRRYTEVPHANMTYGPLEFSGGWQRTIVLAGLLLLAALLYAGAVWRAHRVPDDRAPRWKPDAPRRFAVGSIGGTPGPRLTEDVLDHLADAMGFFLSEEGGRDLNVEASIRATMHHGGTPHLTFYKRKQVRSLLILEDALAEARAWNPLARELAAGIARRGVPVLAGTFQDTPDQFRTADGVLHHLEDLEDQRQGYLLLIFTDGKQLCHQECTFALEALARWPIVAWMDLREPCFWDETARLPTLYDIPIYPASADGLYLTARQLLTEQGVATDYSAYACSWRGPLHQDGMRFDAYIEHLLGDALLWAQSCAMFQPVSPGLADGLRRQLHADLPPERIERLYMLPGTRRTVAGLHFSADVLAVLRRGFLNRRSDQEQEAVLRCILQHVEQARPTEQESMAYLAWETFRERVRLELDADADLSRLAQLARTPLAGHISASLEGFGFPDQPDTIPLRVQLRNPAGLQRLARISDGFRIKQRDAYPIAVIHWVLLGMLCAACLGAAGWSVRQALQPPGHTWELVDHASATGKYAALEVAADAAADEAQWMAVAPPDLLTDVLQNHQPEPGQRYRLTVYDDHGRYTTEFTPPAYRNVRLDLAETEATQPCYDDQTFAESGLTIHRCPSHTRRIPERVDYGTWYAQVEDALPDGPDAGRLMSVGVQIGDSPNDSDMRDRMLWTSSVDIVYQIGPTDDEHWQIDEAVRHIEHDLGPLLGHAQVIVWGRPHDKRNAVIDRLRATAAGHLLSLRPRDLSDCDADGMRGGNTAVCVVKRGGAVLFHPVENQGVIIVSTGNVSATVTLSRGDEEQTVRPGERVALASGDWWVQAVAHDAAHAPVEREIRVEGAQEQVVVLDFNATPPVVREEIGEEEPPQLAADFPVTPSEWQTEITQRTEIFGECTGYWCYIPAGSYTIGGWQDDTAAEIELPAFWIAKYPITVSQYNQFIEDGSYHTEEWWTENGWDWKQSSEVWIQPSLWGVSQFNGSNQPIAGLTWYEAEAFTRWLNAQLVNTLPEGYAVHLPTEAEWETACAYDTEGKRRIYPWGDWPVPNALQANIGQDWQTGPAPVGQRPTGVTAAGVQDMIGTVWEWTASSYGNYPDQSNSALQDFTADLSYVTLRGGSWLSDSTSVRCEVRGGTYPNHYGGFSLNGGIRVLLSPRTAP